MMSPELCVFAPCEAGAAKALSVQNVAKTERAKIPILAFGQTPVGEKERALCQHFLFLRPISCFYVI
jgi:hypothetical protein